MTSADPQFGALREGAEERIHVMPGEYEVSDDANVMLTTLLGSCVVARLRDPADQGRQAEEASSSSHPDQARRHRLDCDGFVDMNAHGKPGEPAGPLHAPMGELLARVGRELGQLSGRLGHVEMLVAPLILTAARSDAQLVPQIQDLDHIRQKVEALADFLAALALVAPDQLLVDASAAVRFVPLADLSARLTLSDDGGERAADWGDCELF